jgi:hypothetical protein
VGFESKTPAATPSHCAQIETLAMTSCPYRTTQGHIAPETVDEPLIGVPLLNTETGLALAVVT